VLTSLLRCAVMSSAVDMMSISPSRTTCTHSRHARYTVDGCRGQQTHRLRDMDDQEPAQARFGTDANGDGVVLLQNQPTPVKHRLRLQLLCCCCCRCAVCPRDSPQEL
jgi:hypothetical protein